MLTHFSRRERRADARSRPTRNRPRLETLEARSLLSFGTGGIVLTDFNNSLDFAADVALRPDGQIVVAGRTNNTFAVARYDGEGNLDSSFDSDGKVIGPLDFGIERGASALALQADGKIVAVGEDLVDSPGGSYQANFDFALARYNSNGSLDKNFDKDGKVTTNLGNLVPGIPSDDQAYDMAIDYGGTPATNPNYGKILVVGVSGDYLSNGRTALVRYNANGSLDRAFGDRGKVVAADWHTEVYAVAINASTANEGKIIVAGRDFLARYNSDGSPDPTFGTNGRASTPIEPGWTRGGRLPQKVISVAIQADGKIVVAGRSGTAFGVARHNPDGSLDSTFGAGGLATTSFGRAGDDGAHAVFVQPDGKIVAAGWSVGTDDDIAVARYNPDGTPDPTFNPMGPLPGTAVTAIALNERAYSLVVQPDGKILVAGSSTSASGWDVALVRYYADGRLDDGSQDPAPLMASGGPRRGQAPTESLASEQVMPLLTEALARWQAVGVDTSSLSNISIQVADLPGATLGIASGNIIWLDANGAGWGWYVDDDPASNVEFVRPGNQGEQKRMDLLSVVMHELGHLLGHEHEDDGVMAETLPAGTRLTMQDAAFSDAEWLLGLGATTKKRDHFGNSPRPRTAASARS